VVTVQGHPPLQKDVYPVDILKLISPEGLCCTGTRHPPPSIRRIPPWILKFIPSEAYVVTDIRQPPLQKDVYLLDTEVDPLQGAYVVTVQETPPFGKMYTPWILNWIPPRSLCGDGTRQPSRQNKLYPLDTGVDSLKSLCCDGP
jgi:hypothetical protein